jgi:hypothetical protein
VRYSILSRAPLVTLGGIAVASAVLRFVVALQVRTPLYYPDEYLYGAISRSIAQGSLGRIRGARVPFGTTVSYVAPLLTSPTWLVHDVAVSYRLSQLIASMAFASSALLAYALARRLGIDRHLACVAAGLTVLVPAGAFTMTLLAEPFAYPALLLAVLIAVDVLAEPTALGALGVVVVSVALCVIAGLQFLLFPVAVVAAYILLASSWRTGLKRLALVGLAVLALLLVVAGIDGGIVSNVLARARAFHYSLGDLSAWFGVNLFVLLVSSGWVIVPGAVVGLRDFAVSGGRRERAFAVLAVLLVIGCLSEAAVWGSNGLGLYERFTFYGSPLIAIGFVRSLRMLHLRREAYAPLAYACGAGAILLPLTSRLFVSDDHSPTLLGLSYGLVVHLSSPPIVWAPLLGLLAVLTALYGTTHRNAVVLVAVAVCLLTNVAGSRALVDIDQGPIPRAHSNGSTTFLTYGGGDPYFMEESLFWNSNLTRVAVLGATPAPDGFASVPVSASARSLLTAADGSLVEGPFAVGPDTVAFSRGQVVSKGGELATFRQAPAVVAFGWYRQLGLLAPFGHIFATGEHAGFTVILRLRPVKKPLDVGLKCISLPQRRFLVGRSGTTIAIRVPTARVRDCRFGLVSGGIVDVRGRHVIARGSISVVP